MRYLGIDWGMARIGLAIGESEIKIASPFGVAKNIQEVLEIIKKEDIERIVLGYPHKMKHKGSGAMDEFEIFNQELKNKSNLEIEFFDERLTTKEASKLIGNSKTKAQEDSIAAMLILQGFFDSI